MEAKTKKALIIWGVIALVVLNLSSLATIWYHRYQYTHKYPNRSQWAQSVKRQGMGMGRHGVGNHSFFTKGLNLSEDQLVRFDSIWNHYATIRRELEQEMRENREKMSTMMNQIEIDTTTLYQLSATQGMLMQELDLSMIKMNLALRTTLNEEQMLTFLQRIDQLSKRKYGRHQGSRMRKNAN